MAFERVRDQRFAEHDGHRNPYSSDSDSVSNGLACESVTKENYV